MMACWIDVSVEGLPATPAPSNSPITCPGPMPAGPTVIPASTAPTSTASIVASHPHLRPTGSRPVAGSRIETQPASDRVWRVCPMSLTNSIRRGPQRLEMSSSTSNRYPLRIACSWSHPGRSEMESTLVPHQTAQP